MRLIDADAFDRDLCNHRFTAALNEAADAGTAFEDKEMYYSTQSFRDVMRYRPTIDAVPLDALCSLLAKNADCPPEHSPVQDHCKENCAECWKSVLKEWMEEDNANQA